MPAPHGEFHRKSGPGLTNAGPPKCSGLTNAGLPKRSGPADADPPKRSGPGALAPGLPGLIALGAGGAMW